MGGSAVTFEILILSLSKDEDFDAA